MHPAVGYVELARTPCSRSRYANWSGFVRAQLLDCHYYIDAVKQGRNGARHR